MLQFLDLFGDAQSVNKATVRHFKLFLPNKSASVSKKRPLEGYFDSDSAKIAKTGIQNQWGVGYGVQTQSWQQPTQGQGQQWPTGYTQQVL